MNESEKEMRHVPTVNVRYQHESASRESYKSLKNLTEEEYWRREVAYRADD